MYLMQARLENLKQIFLGLQKTGIPLIAYNGKEIIPSCTQDDIGIYVLIPKIALLLNCTIESAINIFFASLTFIPALIGLVGFFYLYKNWNQRIITGMALFLCARQAYSIGDVYLAYYAGICALVPWALYYAEKKDFNWQTIFFSFCSGFLIKLLSFIRAYSGFGVFIFISTLFITKKSFSIKQLALLLFFYLVGATIPQIYFSHAYQTSTEYAQKHLPNYQIDQNMHVFWHPIYLGFGLLQWGNNDNIRYDDSFGFQKAKEKSPEIKIYSQEYEAVLQNEVINLIKYNWNFVLFTLFAKLGILFFYLLKYANIGLLTALIYPKPWPLEISFWAAICFYALFPMIGMPTHIEYALGFISFITVYALYSINYALEKQNISVYFSVLKGKTL